LWAFKGELRSASLLPAAELPMDERPLPFPLLLMLVVVVKDVLPVNVARERKG